MLIHAETFALTAIGCLTTNFDNIVLVLSSGKRFGAARCTATFTGILVLAILAGFALSLGIDAALPQIIAWVGLVPLSMGLYELTPRGRASPRGGSKATSWLALGLPLAANSLDTVAVQTAIFSDLSSTYHAAGLVGSFSSAAALAGLTWYIMSNPSTTDRLLPIAGKLRPWVLIVVGTLILMDTGFDAY